MPIYICIGENIDRYGIYLIHESILKDISVYYHNLIILSFALLRSEELSIMIHPLTIKGVNSYRPSNFFASGDIISGFHGGSKVSSISTSSTPGISFTL